MMEPDIYIISVPDKKLFPGVYMYKDLPEIYHSLEEAKAAAREVMAFGDVPYYTTSLSGMVDISAMIRSRFIIPAKEFVPVVARVCIVLKRTIPLKMMMMRSWCERW